MSHVHHSGGEVLQNAVLGTHMQRRATAHRPPEKASVSDKPSACATRTCAPRTGEILIVPRADNANGARAKTHVEHVVHVSVGLGRLYSDYMHAEYGELDSDYVFVNLWGGRRGHPLTYAGVYRLVAGLRASTGGRSRPTCCATPTPPTSCGPASAWISPAVA